MEWVFIGIALLLIAGCGLFVAAEFAFITVDRSSVERAAESGDARSAGVLKALKSLSTQLSGAQLGITITNLAIGFLAEPSIASLIDDPLMSVGLSEGAARGVSVGIALVLATALTMIFGELVPKNLAIAKPLATARTVAGFQRWFTKSTAYLIRGLNGTANAILRLMNIEPQEELASARSPQELVSLVGRSAEKGTLEPETASLVQRSLAFGDRRASDVMTPRVRMHALRAGDPVRAVFAEVAATGRSRFPVVEGDHDAVVGVVHVKQAVTVEPEERDTTPVSSVMIEPLVVPSSMQLDALMATLRKGDLQMAIVLDEFGEADGVVTLEDLIEELVGEVKDEHDPPEIYVVTNDDGTFVASGLLRPDEVSEATGLPFKEDEEYETIAGLLTFHLGTVPELGDTVEVDLDDPTEPVRRARLTAAEMDGMRVDRVKIEPLEPVTDDASSGSDKEDER